VGHVRNQCPEPLSPRSVRETFNTPASPQTSPRQRRQVPQPWFGFEQQCPTCHDFGHSQHRCSSSLISRKVRRNVNFATLQQSRSLGWAQQEPRSGLKCFLCGKAGHLARNCLIRPKIAAMIRDESEREKTEVKAAACQLVVGKPSAKPRMPSNSTAEPEMSAWPCQQHNRIRCRQCLYLPKPAHRCRAMVVVCQHCGQRHPVVADACLLQDKTHKMPVADEIVEGTPVSLLRDTGCSTVMVRQLLIPDEKLTGL